jgi:hypothetical protein
MTSTLTLTHAGRELCAFEATDKNMKKLQKRMGSLSSLDPNDFLNAATRLMDDVGDLAGPDLDLALVVVIGHIVKTAEDPQKAKTITDKIGADMIRGDDGRFQRFAFTGFEPAQSPHTLTLEYEGTEIFVFEATPESIKDLNDEVMAAKPQGDAFLGAATRLMDDPDHPQRADLGLILFMALREISTADGTDDETIADILAAKNIHVKLVRHDDAGVFHFHFYDANGDDNDDEVPPHSLH